MPIDAQLTEAAISKTAARIAPYLRRTPALVLDRAEFGLSGGPLTLKLECLQHSGSFKARGAFSALTSGPMPAAGVAAASGGNHGAAVACAARVLGLAARIFVPEISSPAKIDRIRSYGAELVVEGERYADALARCQAWVTQNGAREIHAYDQIETLLGQGTLGCELEEQAPAIDTLLVAVGGGGLIGGLASWYRGRIRIVAVEPEAAPTLSMARAAGRPVDAPQGGIAADSLAPLQVGQLMFPIAEAYVERSVLVPDAAIVEAQHRLWDRLRIVTEPGGATAFAALISGAYVPQPAERVGVLVCGANTTAVEFSN